MGDSSSHKTTVIAFRTFVSQGLQTGSGLNSLPSLRWPRDTNIAPCSSHRSDGAEAWSPGYGTGRHPWRKMGKAAAPCQLQMESHYSEQRLLAMHPCPLTLQGWRSGLLSMTSHQASALLQLRQERQEYLGAGLGPAFCLLLRPKPELARHVDLSGLWGSWGKAVALPSRTAFFLASAPGRRHESTKAPHQWPSSSKLGSWAGREATTTLQTS